MGPDYAAQSAIFGPINSLWEMLNVNFFDWCPDRKGTYAQKWDGQGGNYIPMWVADMDLAAPQQIVDAVIQRARHPVYGYTAIGPRENNCIVDYYKRLYQADIDPEWIIWVPAVMPGANMACRMLSGSMMLNTPMYPHIRKLSAETGLPAVEVPLKQENQGHYSFDFAAMERAAIAHPDLKAFLLCNPHNPVGRVYTRTELTHLADFCKEYKLIVISDEIHSELIFDGHEHIPFFLLNDWAMEHSITLTSGAKTYNIPCLPVGFAVIPGKELRNRYERFISGLSAVPNVLALEATRTAYNDCREWKNALLLHLQANRDYMEQQISNMPGVFVTHNEATFLAWIDCRELNIEDPWKFFRDQAGVNFSNGVDFGAPGFVRINFACTRGQLAQALDRMQQSLEGVLP